MIENIVAEGENVREDSRIMLSLEVQKLVNSQTFYHENFRKIAANMY